MLSASAMPVATPDNLVRSESSVIQARWSLGRSWDRRGWHGHHRGWGGGRHHHRHW
jgi:hypothetical protein